LAFGDSLTAAVMRKYVAMPAKSSLKADKGHFSRANTGRRTLHSGMQRSSPMQRWKA
jgi:hypothetical protein